MRRAVFLFCGRLLSLVRVSLAQASSARALLRAPAVADELRALVEFPAPAAEQVQDVRGEDHRFVAVWVGGCFQDVRFQADRFVDSAGSFAGDYSGAVTVRGLP